MKQSNIIQSLCDLVEDETILEDEKIQETKWGRDKVVWTIE